MRNCGCARCLRTYSRVVAGVTSILDHCEMGGRAEGAFRVSEQGVLVITSAVGELVDDGELKIDF